MHMFRVLVAFATLAVGVSSAPAMAAEVSEFRIAQQFGIGYLPLTIMKTNSLVEKHL